MRVRVRVKFGVRRLSEAVHYDVVEPEEVHLSIFGEEVFAATMCHKDVDPCIVYVKVP